MFGDFGTNFFYKMLKINDLRDFWGFKMWTVCEKKVVWTALASFLCVFLLACDRGGQVPGQGENRGSPASQVEPRPMEYSGNLWLGTRSGEEVAEIYSFVGRDTLKHRFILRRREEMGVAKPVPDSLKGATVLYVPVQKVVALSSAQIGYMVRLGVQDRIVGIGEGRYVYDSTLYARAINGEVREVGNGGTLDLEKVVALEPDLVMTFATGGAHDDYERINALSLPLMLTSEWQEETPLAKAEWIKLYGKLFGVEPLADSIFEQSKKNYLNTANGGVAGVSPAEGVADDKGRSPTKSGMTFGRSEGETSSVNDSSLVTSNSELVTPNSLCPRVLVGMSYGGIWYAPGGNSFTARLIKDAGGCYLWASDTSRELKFTLEEIMLVADSADVWVNPGMFSTTAELLASEPRVEHIRAFREKRVCQNDGRKGPGGGNDFYESAVAYPAELLQNLRNCLYNATIGPDSASLGLDWYHNISIF